VRRRRRSSTRTGITDEMRATADALKPRIQAAVALYSEQAALAAEAVERREPHAIGATSWNDKLVIARRKWTVVSDLTKQYLLILRIMRRLS